MPLYLWICCLKCSILVYALSHDRATFYSQRFTWNHITRKLPLHTMVKEGCVGFRGPLLFESAVISPTPSFESTNALKLIVIRHSVHQPLTTPITLNFEPIALHVHATAVVNQSFVVCYGHRSKSLEEHRVYSCKAASISTRLEKSRPTFTTPTKYTCETKVPIDVLPM